MTPTQILALVALTFYAVYKQSTRHEIIGKTRFKLAAIYIGVGLVTGGFYLPPSATAWSILGGSVLASVLVGVARGRLSKVWAEPDGRIHCQGTPLSIGLFLALIAAKYALGAWQYLTHQPSEHGGFGEVLVMIGLMVAMQAEIIWRRALALRKSMKPTRRAELAFQE
ncbi:hypothetical protein QTI66_24970 [Variovorax sp. J22R133]|uniref:hypothetical protein n=1 Tax=Variovorax brevis TaxID=3053503 RepID=UPI002578B88F|nr:hypothetical protein [Variovorax sp. J22R133]MDM0115426.1 hypothetical protein [Variovorax sp. J22R133]